jgi:hypothetical protein
MGAAMAETPIQEIQQRAEQGDVGAQYELGKNTWG